MQIFDVTEGYYCHKNSFVLKYSVIGQFHGSFCSQNQGLFLLCKPGKIVYFDGMYCTTRGKIHRFEIKK